LGYVILQSFPMHGIDRNWKQAGEFPSFESVDTTLNVV